MSGDQQGKAGEHQPDQPEDQVPGRPSLAEDEPLEGEMDDVEANNAVSNEHPSS